MERTAPYPSPCSKRRRTGDLIFQDRPARAPRQLLATASCGVAPSRPTPMVTIGVSGSNRRIGDGQRNRRPGLPAIGERQTPPPSFPPPVAAASPLMHRRDASPPQWVSTRQREAATGGHGLRSGTPSRAASPSPSIQRLYHPKRHPRPPVAALSRFHCPMRRTSASNTLDRHIVLAA